MQSAVKSTASAFILPTMMIIGLTGGIGSGKSTASSRFAEHGVTVINADHIAREVVTTDSPALRAIAERFGPDILQPDGSLNRTALREIVFDDQHQLDWLEQLTHPLIEAIIRQRLQTSRQPEEPPYRMLESPLLLETQQKNLVDRVLLIDSPEALQIERVAGRDNNSGTQVKKIIASQMPREKKLSLADDVIENTATREELYQQVDSLHNQYCQLAKN